jgi:hypothetical protein
MNSPAGRKKSSAKAAARLWNRSWCPLSRRMPDDPWMDYRPLIRKQRPFRLPTHLTCTLSKLAVSLPALSLPVMGRIRGVEWADGACYGLVSSGIRFNALGETNIPKVRQLSERNSTMGDRSPKSVQKQASQKQSKNNDSNQKKQALITSQQATKAKAAANKKK